VYEWVNVRQNGGHWVCESAIYVNAVQVTTSLCKTDDSLSFRMAQSRSLRVHWCAKQSKTHSKGAERSWGADSFGLDWLISSSDQIRAALHLEFACSYKTRSQMLIVLAWPITSKPAWSCWTFSAWLSL